MVIPSWEASSIIYSRGPQRGNYLFERTGTLHIFRSKSSNQLLKKSLVDYVTIQFITHFGQVQDSWDTGTANPNRECLRQIKKYFHPVHGRKSAQGLLWGDGVRVDLVDFVLRRKNCQKSKRSPIAFSRVSQDRPKQYIHKDLTRAWDL